MAKSQQKGFTIIEVVLVLAIAGLIFLIVFLAVPALQRNQRDTQRRNDASRVLAAVQNYQSNNNGQVPLADDPALVTFKNSYLKVGDDTFADPSGTEYTLNAGEAGNAQVADNEMYYYTSAKCAGEVTASANARSVAVRVNLEGAGAYCVDNS